jgi:hypothetical protein
MSNTYHRNMAYSDLSRDDVATPWFAARRDEQRRAHAGDVLRDLAEYVYHRLPTGPVTLLSLSVEGCALAAVVATLRNDDTTWQQFALAGPHPERHGKTVVVEPVLLGSGVLQSLKELLPDADVVHGIASATAAPALASVA